MRSFWTKKSVGVGALVVVLLLSVVVCFAQGGPPPPMGPEGGPPPMGGPHRGPGGPGGVLGPLARDLNLTDAQKEQIKQLEDKFAANTKELHEQMLKAGGDPFDALKDGAFDEAAVRAAAQARANIQVELEVAHARLLSQVYALLTAEQKAQLAARRQQFEQERQHWGAPHEGNSKQN